MTIKSTSEIEFRKTNSGKLIKYVKCSCGCGVELWIREDRLKNKTHCGCETKKRFKDLSSLRFGAWTVGKEYKDQHWLCTCDCGKIKFVDGYTLQKGKSVSCGSCEYSDRGKKNTKDNATKLLVYRTYKRGAKERDLELNIDFDTLIEMVQKDCFYCGRQPLRLESTATETFIHHGLDRKNNDIGYTVNNCVPCCKECNFAKRTLNHNQFLDLIKNIYENKNLQDEQPLSYSERLKFTKDNYPDYFKEYKDESLDIGCGDRKDFWLPSAVTIDMYNYGQTIIKDITRTPWPIADNQFKILRAQHILEHIKDSSDFISILNELARVAKPGAIFIGEVPRFTSPNYFRDFTHCRPMSENSFDMFLEGTKIHVGSGYDIQCKFRPLNKGIWVNENQDVCWQLQVIK